MDDYYKILGIGYTDNQKTIHDAFIKLVLKYHPDVNKDKRATIIFEKINKAYQVLSKQKLKLKYDKTHKSKYVIRYYGSDQKAYSKPTDEFNQFLDAKNSPD